MASELGEIVTSYKGSSGHPTADQGVQSSELLEFLSLVSDGACEVAIGRRMSSSTLPTA